MSFLFLTFFSRSVKGLPVRIFENTKKRKREKGKVTTIECFYKF